MIIVNGARQQGSYICLYLTLFQSVTSQSNTIDPIVFSRHPGDVHCRTISPLNSGIKVHPTMIFTFPLLISFLLLGVNELWAHVSQLEMEMSLLEDRLGGIFVPNLDQCPRLPPRTPSSVHDLYVQTPA